jgi:signal transduction histidine kinase/FixJ family two-component response regulator
LESRLIEKNVILVEQINKLINEAEATVANEFLEKTVEADRLAEVTYRRLAVYTISAVFLLLIALFVLFNYLRKTRSTQRALADARKKAESLAHAKEQFAANVSHELRTPVNAIYGLTEQVLQEKLDNNTSEMISVIFKSAKHLRNIVNDTLDFSKIQSNNIIIESVHFYPVEIFDEVYSLVKHEATNKGIELKITWEGEKPGVLIGDPFRLKQIIINLIGNSIKFTEKGEVAILIKTLKLNGQNIELEIQVRDTGIGIEKNNLNIIFDEYVQIENVAGKKYSGTGLGLAIVKKLVELQGGKIKLESNPGEGTKVTVNIKYRKGDTEKIKQAKSEVLKIPKYFTQLSVLIADDEEYNRFLLKSILQKWGISFKEVQNGNEAIVAACSENFDIIMMDINMPVTNGIEAAKEIIKCDSGTQIIAVTAVTDQLDQKACIKVGMKGFLFKPYSEKELFDTINSLINDNTNNRHATNLKHPINFAELRHLAGDDDKFLVEMIQLFIKSMETGISGIEDAIKKEKWDEVFENAHKMAAPVKHIGASNLYKNIKQLETISKGSATVVTVSAIFKEIKNEVMELNKMLKTYLNKIKL